MQWDGRNWKQDVIRLSAALCIVFAVQATRAESSEDSLPRYDADRFCQQITGVVLGDKAFHARCVDDEKHSYQLLGAAWTSLSLKDRQRCETFSASIGGGAYSVLTGCLELGDF